jgi:lipopolysaccharide export system ATP-binding protein
LADRDAGSLSGGERRRLELCRVLALDPKVILLDEPFSGVDPRAVEEIQTLMQAMKARGIGMVLTDHNAHETLAITDRTYILVGGTIAAEGTPKTLAADPAVRRAYLGESFVLKDHAAPSAPPSPRA